MFRYTLMVVAALILLTPMPMFCGAADEPVAGVPTLKEVVPAVAVPGTVVLATGEFLDRLHVSEVYLTQGTKDIKVTVTAQAKSELKFKIPADTEPGRYGVTLLTTGQTPMLLDQPVYLVVKREIESTSKR